MNKIGVSPRLIAYSDDPAVLIVKEAEGLAIDKRDVGLVVNDKHMMSFLDDVLNLHHLGYYADAHAGNVFYGREGLQLIDVNNLDKEFVNLNAQIYDVIWLLTYVELGSLNRYREINAIDEDVELEEVDVILLCELISVFLKNTIRVVSYLKEKCYDDFIFLQNGESTGDLTSDDYWPEMWAAGSKQSLVKKSRDLLENHCKNVKTDDLKKCENLFLELEKMMA